jgi:hypothetical protein
MEQCVKWEKVDPMRNMRQTINNVSISKIYARLYKSVKYEKMRQKRKKCVKKKKIIIKQKMRQIIIIASNGKKWAEMRNMRQAMNIASNSERL